MNNYNNVKVDILTLIAKLTESITGELLNYYRISGMDKIPENTRFLNEDFVIKRLSILDDSVLMLCPLCKKDMPLVLDEDLIFTIINSCLKNTNDINHAKFPTLKEIREMLRESAEVHPVPCKGLHETQCKFNKMNFMTLEDLLHK